MAEAVDRAYRAIREGIVTGAFPQGAHITAQELAAATGVSRTPVREAMRRLHAEGLIHIIPNRGAFVASWSEQDVDQYYELVVLLESFAAELAAKRIGDDDLAELKALNAEMDRLIAQPRPSAPRIKEVNDRFHEIVRRASGNTRVEGYLASMIEAEIVMGTLTGYDPEELKRSAMQHAELVAAFEAGDPVWAKSVMATHILSARHAFLRSVRERQAN
jgi:DNA-binding GntR family transcriptional regulator